MAVDEAMELWTTRAGDRKACEAEAICKEIIFIASYFVSYS